MIQHGGDGNFAKGDGIQNPGLGRSDSIDVDRDPLDCISDIRKLVPTLINEAEAALTQDVKLLELRLVPPVTEEKRLEVLVRKRCQRLLR